MSASVQKLEFPGHSGALLAARLDLPNGPVRAYALFARRHLRGKLLREAADRLVPDLKGEGAPGADLVIEAVPEKLALKESIYAAVEPRMKAGAILASNTSSLKLEDLRSGLKRPEGFVGIHFFNPVAQMQLVEIGQAFGGRDHSTVIHSVDKVSRQMTRDRSFRERVEHARQELSAE